jgi:hypothetical protein
MIHAAAPPDVAHPAGVHPAADIAEVEMLITSQA